MFLSVASCFCLSRPFPCAMACFHRHSLLVFFLAHRPLALILSLLLCSIIAVFRNFCLFVFCLCFVWLFRCSVCCFCCLLLLLLLRRLRCLLLYLCDVFRALINSLVFCCCLFVCFRYRICDDFNIFVFHSIGNNIFKKEFL